MSSTPYDILKRHSDGSFIWLEAASELSHAKDRLQQLYAAIAGRVFRFRPEEPADRGEDFVEVLPPGD